MWGASEPTGCDEGPGTEQSSTNGRGDVVEEYMKACTGFGTIIDYSIVLQLKGDEKMMTLATHEWLRYDYPQFTWINDDELNIALGNVAWVSHKVEKVGSIRITYSYTKTGWW
ncbi:hypothetical protein SAMN05444581_10613 [Methylocapsa palsarum]|uniref:Uncharacterized protein n=2 Tax=Methylocapsa palsarum TaxID=1612308 RepID=A0A1I3YK85_9HYPH|nr:hypothetical protein SAMN05444581_10613 [Methylocapsa palsarum]